jgi:hypothetical protein
MHSVPVQPRDLPEEGLLVSEHWCRELLWAPGSRSSKVWEIRGANCKYRGRLGIIETGKNEASVHLMRGSVIVVDCHRMADLAELNANQGSTGLSHLSNSPYPVNWAIVCSDPVLYETPVPILTKAQKFVCVRTNPRTNIVKHLTEIFCALPFAQTHELRLHLSYICRPCPKKTRGYRAQRGLRRSGVYGGRVFVAVSGIAENCLGLFMGVGCKKGEIVDSYSGALMEFDDVRLPASHARTIIRRSWVLDGTAWATYFRHSAPNVKHPEAFFQTQSQLPADKRTHLLPVSGCPLMDAVATLTGCGYMANTSDVKRDINVGVEPVQHHRGGDVALPSDSSWMLVATKPLAKYDEIISPYCNDLDSYLEVQEF